MMGFFRPAELKATLKELDGLRPLFKQDPEAVEIAFGEARRVAVLEKANTVASIRAQNWKPRDLALLLVSKMSFRHAASGNHHIYRNAPTTTGYALRGIFQQAGEAMVASGFIQQSDHEEDQRSIRKAMAEVG